ncbi:MAG: hypothetical protein K8R46_10040, partial [Pirellulales bacterium]|nr:hypothetical protein [Pirellulales bacterium]
MNNSFLAKLAASLLCVSLPVGCTADQRTEQQRMIDEIKQLGGIITRDEERLDRPVFRVELGNRPADDSLLKRLKVFDRLESLTLGHTRITNDGLAYLKELPRLQRLNIRYTAV